MLSLPGFPLQQRTLLSLPPAARPSTLLPATDDDDDVYYYIGERPKLAGETENMGV